MRKLPDYRIYRNLHKNCFSIQKWIPEKKGYRIIKHANDIVANNVEFKVYQSGRNKVLSSKQKNVHAFVYCNNFTLNKSQNLGNEIYYNPYQFNSFVIKNTNQPIHKINTLILTNNKCYEYI